jgi:hypothetical protein
MIMIKIVFNVNFFQNLLSTVKIYRTYSIILSVKLTWLKKYPAEYILIKMAKEGEPTDIHILTNCDQIVQDICLIQKGCRNDDYTGALVIYDYKHDVNIWVVVLVWRFYINLKWYVLTKYSLVGRCCFLLGINNLIYRYGKPYLFIFQGNIKCHNG